MRNYPEKFINDLQKNIDSEKVTVENINSFNDLPKVIRVSGTSVIITEEKGIKSSMVYSNDSFNKDEMVKWKHTPAGQFYSKDWKRANKGEATYELYSILTTTLGNLTVTALLRKISESDYYSDEEYMKATDVMINECRFVIIKAFADAENFNGALLCENFGCDSILEIKKGITYDQCNAQISSSNENEESFDDIPDAESEPEDEMVELF